MDLDYCIAISLLTLWSPMWLSGFLTYYPVKYIVNTCRGLPKEALYMQKKNAVFHPKEGRGEALGCIMFGPFMLPIVLAENAYRWWKGA